MEEMEKKMAVPTHEDESPASFKAAAEKEEDEKDKRKKKKQTQ